MTAQRLVAELDIKGLPSRWYEFYDEVSERYKERTAELTDITYLSSLFEKNIGLERYRADIELAAKKIRENPELSMFMCLLDKSLESASSEKDEIFFPRGEGCAYHFYCLFPMLATIEQSERHLRKRGLPEEIITATLSEYADCIELYSLHNGYTGFGSRYFGWTQLLVNNKLIHIGRLNFELSSNFRGKIKVFENDVGERIIMAHNVRVHRGGRLLGAEYYEDEDGAFDANVYEDDLCYIGNPVDELGYVKKEKLTLKKSEWHICLQEGDKVISVHIPRSGSLAKEICEASYEEARKIFEKHYPDFKYKAFVCTSWMLDKQLGKLLKPESNIVSFQNKYISFPTVSDGSGVFSFVFLRPQDTELPDINYNELPENTSLERTLKKHYLSGKCIYEDGGLFLV